MSTRPNNAYRDAGFMGSPDARTLRILAEYVEPESRFSTQGIDLAIVFFGSARALPMEAATTTLAKARQTGADNDGKVKTLDIAGEAGTLLRGRAPTRTLA